MVISESEGIGTVKLSWTISSPSLDPVWSSSFLISGQCLVVLGLHLQHTCSEDVRLLLQDWVTSQSEYFSTLSHSSYYLRLLYLQRKCVCVCVCVLFVSMCAERMLTQDFPETFLKTESFVQKCYHF